VSERRRRPAGFLVACMVSFLISAVTFSGLILGADVTGRVIFGLVWAVLGVVWLGFYFGAFSGSASRSPKDGTAA